MDQGRANTPTPAVTGHLKTIPEGKARPRRRLRGDAADEVMVGDALPFDRLMQACGEVEANANDAAAR